MIDCNASKCSSSPCNIASHEHSDVGTDTLRQMICAHLHYQQACQNDYLQVHLQLQVRQQGFLQACVASSLPGAGNERVQGIMDLTAFAAEVQTMHLQEGVEAGQCAEADAAILPDVAIQEIRFGETCMIHAIACQDECMTKEAGKSSCTTCNTWLQH